MCIDVRIEVTGAISALVVAAVFYSFGMGLFSAIAFAAFVILLAAAVIEKLPHPLVALLAIVCALLAIWRFYAWVMSVT